LTLNCCNALGVTSRGLNKLLSSIDRVLTTLTNLRDLEISGIPLTKKCAELIGALSLQRLSIGDCSRLEQADFNKLCTHHLLELELKGCTWLKSTSVIAKLPNSCSCSKIKSLQPNCS
jgi:hypothetical protein